MQQLYNLWVVINSLQCTKSQPNTWQIKLYGNPKGRANIYILPFITNARIKKLDLSSKGPQSKAHGWGKCDDKGWGGGRRSRRASVNNTSLPPNVYSLGLSSLLLWEALFCVDLLSLIWPPSDTPLLQLLHYAGEDCDIKDTKEKEGGIACINVNPILCRHNNL